MKIGLSLPYLVRLLLRRIAHTPTHECYFCLIFMTEDIINVSPRHSSNLVLFSKFMCTTLSVVKYFMIVLKDVECPLLSLRGEIEVIDGLKLKICVRF